MRTKTAALSVLLVVSAYGQKTPESKTPDQRFAELTALAAPTPVAKTNNGDSKTRDQVATEIATQAAAAKQTAQLAKDFYTENPNHPKAAEAQKIEALSTVRSVQAGDSVREQAALTLAKAYRERKDIPAKDRFEVALAAERLALSSKIKAKTAADQPIEWQLVSERLKGEFGDLSELHDFSMEIARRADLPTAVKIASSVASSPKASQEAKARAQSVMDRASLPGRRVNLKLPKIDGGEFDFSAPQDKLTFVLVWSVSDPLSLESAQRFAKALPKDAQLVYIALGGTTAQVTKLKASAPIAGIHCHAPAGASSRNAFEELKLRYAPLPSLYVFNRVGAVSGVGQVSEFTSLLAAASR